VSRFVSAWLTGPLRADDPPRDVTNGIGMKFVLIPAGEFQMGTSSDEPKQIQRIDKAFNAELAVDEAPKHLIRISQPFYLGMYEVTRRQFSEFVKATRYRTDAERDKPIPAARNETTGIRETPSKFTWNNAGFVQSDDHPVVNVSWNDAVAFCDWLKKTERREYRLPTEAEWEYACRAGTTTLFQFGDRVEDLSTYANIADQSARVKFANWAHAIDTDDGYPCTAPVGKLKPNAWGLYDMHGNVWEWCSDIYDKEFYKQAFTYDPPGAKAGSLRVCRGGSWAHSPKDCRSAVRLGLDPAARNQFRGLRIARSF
jgi:formylglycine-generating enzyme